jgi:hypothetical protein
MGDTLAEDIKANVFDPSSKVMFPIFFFTAFQCLDACPTEVIRRLVNRS